MEFSAAKQPIGLKFCTKESSMRVLPFRAVSAGPSLQMGVFKKMKILACRKPFEKLLASGERNCARIQAYIPLPFDNLGAICLWVLSRKL